MSVPQQQIDSHNKGIKPVTVIMMQHSLLVVKLVDSHKDIKPVTAMMQHSLLVMKHVNNHKGIKPVTVMMRQCSLLAMKQVDSHKGIKPVTDNDATLIAGHEAG